MSFYSALKKTLYMFRLKADFNKWALTYDEQVFKESPTDHWMFGGYERVLDKIVEYCQLKKNKYASVLDIGVGTGNLAVRFLQQKMTVYGIDPSEKMRKACGKKFPEINAMAGHFLKYPHYLEKVDLIVSAYAFHHLTEAEKAQAVPVMKSLLKPGGRIVIADFMFRNADERETVSRSVRETSGVDILAVFKDEFPALYDGLVPVFEKEGFKVDGEQLTVAVWIIRACL